MKQLYFNLRVCVVLSLLVTLTGIAYAQRSVTGIVTDGSAPLPGVSVLVKGTSRGTMTDQRGAFSIKANDNETLVFRFVGFLPHEVLVGQKSVVNVSLKADNSDLKEVVVTALGVQRERRSLGYATSTIKGEDLTVAGPTLNPFLAIYGKAAGVGVTTGSGGPAGGINIRIRGNASLNTSPNNPDLAASNRPLFVVDGVPIRDEATSMVNRTYDPYNSFDYGSGINDLNAEDIESIEVLKGAKATVLYGKEAGNGVVLITTKKGRETRGFGIQASFNSTFDKPVSFIDFQNEYGTGESTSDIQYATVNGKQVRKMVNDRYSFGPKFDNSPIMMYDSTMTTYHAYPNNFMDMFRDGLINNANVAIAGAGPMGNMRLSYTNKDFKDILPGFSQRNNTFSFSGAINASKLAKFEVNVNYYNVSTTNRRPNLEQVVAWGLNRDYDYSFVKDFYKDATGYQRILDDYSLPPSFSRIKSLLVEQNDNYDNDNKNRWLASLRTVLNFTDYLSFVGNAGLDYTVTDFTTKNRVTRIIPKIDGGYFGIRKTYGSSVNIQGMLNFDKTYIDNNLRIFAFGGGSYRRQADEDVKIGTYGNFAFPDWYSFKNEQDWPASGEKSKVRDYSRGSDLLYSAFGSVTASWKEKYHVEFQARNDWDSTLPSYNNSYFYPGLSFTWNYDDLFHWTPFKMGTLRLAWADVGFGTSRYRAYEAVTTYNANTTNAIGVKPPDEQFANKFEPARKREYEIGMNNRFFEGNRLEVDLTYYNNNTRNEIVPISISWATGSNAFLVNTGRVNRWGLEAYIKGSPILKKNLRLDVVLTASKQESEVKSLAPGLKQYVLKPLWGGANVVAEVGKPYGDIKMYDYTYDDKRNKVVGDDGFYLHNTDLQTGYKAIANVMPDVFGGLMTDLYYKGFSVHLAADYKFGGRVFSMSNYYLIGNGVVTQSLPYRDEEHGGLAYYLDAQDKKVPWNHNQPAPAGAKNGIVYHNGMILPGVKQTNNGYASNDILVSSTDYYSSNIMDNQAGYYYPDNLYKNDYIKMREVALSYTLPAKITRSIKMEKVTLTASARNLFYIYKTLPNVDAESALGAEEYLENSFYPTTRSLNLGVSVSF